MNRQQGESWGGWIAGNTGQNEWLQVALDRVTEIGAIATQGHPGGHFTRTYRIRYSLDGTEWTTYSDQAAGGPKEFNGNYDGQTVVVNRFARPFLARFLRVEPLESSYNWPTLRLELYAVANEQWMGGQPLGITDGKVPNSAMTASSAHGNNWEYHGPQHGRLWGGGPWGGWIPQWNSAGQWIQVDFGKEVAVGSIATQGRRDGSYWMTSYFLAYSQDGNTWKSYTEGGLRKLLPGNTEAYSQVKKNTLSEPFLARYVRIIVNEFANGWPVVRFEAYAPESTAHRLGNPLGVSTGRYPASALTASSAYAGNWHYYGPQNARLDSSTDYGAALTNTAAGEWYQVDLGSPTEVGGFATQGRKWGGCWVTNYSVLYSLDGGSAWNWVMSRGTKSNFMANGDGDQVMPNVLQTPIVARYVRFVVNTYWNHPCFRFEVYAPHASRLNTGKIDSMGIAMGVESGSIPDSAITASSFFPTNMEDCAPRRGRLNSKRGAGAWCAKDNTPDQWIQVETDGTFAIGGIATQGRAQDSDAFKGYSQWVTSYLVHYSADGKEWKTVKTADGNMDQYFRANLDSSTVVQNAFEPALENVKFIRVNPQGWYSHISMRLEIFDTQARQIKIKAEAEAVEKRKAEELAKQKAELEEKARKEREERLAREKKEAEEREKAEEEAKEAKHAAALAKNDEDRKVAAALAQKAKADLAQALKDKEELEAQEQKANNDHLEKLSILEAKIRATNEKYEDNKFDESQLQEALKKISQVEDDIAAEKTKQLAAKVAWGEREQELKDKKVLIGRVKDAIVKVNEMIADEKKKLQGEADERQGEIKKYGGIDGSLAAEADPKIKDGTVEIKKQ